MDKLKFIQAKILSREELVLKRNLWKFFEQKVVFTNGCFDIVHLGHVDYLAKAAYLGDKMIVGLNTDASVSKLKGSSRPVQDEYSRAMLIAAFHFVDAVVLFDEETPFDLISLLKPDVLVKGADYTIDKIVGSDLVLASGGTVKTIEYLAGYSTSSIISKIQNS